MRSECFAETARLDAIRKANRRRMVSVVAAFDLTPHMRRLVLKEHEASTSEPARPAEWITLHVPWSGNGRPHGRAYTIRDRSNGNLTIDMAMHGGLCASWAKHARVGDVAEISGPRNGFKLVWPKEDVLMGADETGLPAVATILASLSSQTRGTVWIEIPDEGDALRLAAPPAVTVRFLPRRTKEPGRLLAQAMRQTQISQATTVWVAGERSAALELRDHFRAALPREQVYTSGYWRMASRASAGLDRLATPARASCRLAAPGSFSRFATKLSGWSGRPPTFAIALALILTWGISGPFFGFSANWQLVVNTLTTIVTFLMVFMLQNSQNRDGKALQAKIDELIRSSEARNTFVGIEKLDEERLQDLCATHPDPSGVPRDGDVMMLKAGLASSG